MARRAGTRVVRVPEAPSGFWCITRTDGTDVGDRARRLGSRRARRLRAFGQNANGALDGYLSGSIRGLWIPMGLERMDRRYWDRLAPQYDEEILSSFDADLSGIIARRLDELAGPRKTALDFGCGVGKYLPPLAARFQRVLGVDHSEPLLAVARRDHGDLANVTLRTWDAGTGRAVPGPRRDVVVCANVLIMADAGLRDAILRSAIRSLAPKGRLLLVVPSLESALWAHRLLVHWYEREGSNDPESEAAEDGFPPSARTCRELLRGIVRIDGVPTRHYLAEDLRLLLHRSGLEVLHLDRVFYDWHSEFERPPRWMRDPFPWDWLAVAHRR